MDKRYRVSGLFVLEVEAEDSQEASRKAERIMRDSGIEGHVIEVEMVKKMGKTRKEYTEYMKRRD